MKTFARSDRIGGHIQKALSKLLAGSINDPRLELAVITGVRMTRDLRLARIYFVISGGKVTKNEAVDGFESALGYIKRTLAGQLGLRYMPELRFYYDESFDYFSKIDNVLKSIDIESEDGSNNTTFEKE
jgi:ribosome-binding factor A